MAPLKHTYISVPTRKDIKLRTEYNGLKHISQQKSKQDFLYNLINSFGGCDLRNRAFEVAKNQVSLHIRTGQTDIPRSYAALATGSHVQTVTRATNFLEEIGIYSVIRGFKRVNKYLFNHLDVLEYFFQLSVDSYNTYARLFNSKLNISNKLVSKSYSRSRFSINFKPEKGKEGEDICFSPKTGVYIPLELRPLDNTILISREDSASLVGVKYNYLFPDYEKLERLAKLRAKEAAIRERIRKERAAHEARNKALAESGVKITGEEFLSMFFNKI